MGAFVNLNLAKTVISDCDFDKRFDVEFFFGGETSSYLEKCRVICEIVLC